MSIIFEIALTQHLIAQENEAALRVNQDARQQPANGHFPDADLAKLRVVTQSRGRGGGHAAPEELPASLISDGLLMYEQQLQGSRVRHWESKLPALLKTNKS